METGRSVSSGDVVGEARDSPRVLWVDRWAESEL